jgi:pilus assembly protein CpaF
MSLRERLARSGEADDAAPTAGDANKDEIKRSLHFLVIEEMREELDDETRTEESLRYSIENRLGALLDADGTPLSAADRREIITDVVDNILGYGPIQPLLDDPTVTEVMVNGPTQVYIELKGKLTLSDVKFVDNDHAKHIGLQRLVTTRTIFGGIIFGGKA